MALRKAVCPLATFVLSRSLKWRLGKETTAACVSVTVSQQYSRRLAFSEEELQARANFLSRQFQAPESEMHHFLSCNQQLVTMGREKFHRLSELLAQHGISTKELTTYPNIYRRKYDTVASRIRQLEEGRVGPVTIRMINTTYKKYQAKYGRLILDAEAAERYKSTVHLLSCELGFTEQEAGLIVGESVWLDNTKLSTLREKIDLLRSYGVTSQAIRERVWVLAFPTSTIRARLDSLKGSGLSFQDFPKSYLIAIKSSEDKFCKFQERLVLDKSILSDSGCSDKPSYLCARLSCSPGDLKVMVKKFPALLSVRLPKLRTNLDLLIHEFGVPPSVIQEWPRMLGLGSDTLRDRLRQLQDHDVPVSGRVLYLSNHDYEKFIDKLDSSV